MRFLVIGGTGFIGTPVVKNLMSKGHEVYLFHRGNTESTVEVTGTVLGDRKEIGRYKGDFDEIAPDVVIDIIPYFRQDVLNTLTALEGVTERIVAISSVDVYKSFGILNNFERGKVDPAVLTEESKLRKNLYLYRDMKCGMDNYEKILVEKEYLNHKTIEGSVVRLPMVYGPGDRKHRIYEFVRRMSDDREHIIMEERFSKWIWSKGHVDNIAEAIAIIAESGVARKKVYNIADQNRLTMKEWVEKIGEAYGWKGEVVILPSDSLPDRYCSTMLMEQNIIVDSSKIRKELYFNEVTDFEEGLKEAINWEIANAPENIPIGYFDYKLENELLKNTGIIVKK